MKEGYEKEGLRDVVKLVDLILLVDHLNYVPQSPPLTGSAKTLPPPAPPKIGGELVAPPPSF